MEGFEILIERLEANHNFPTVYMFKFIVPNSPEKEAEFQALFPGVELATKISKNGKFIGYTANVMMNTPLDIARIYKKATTIAGVIAL